MEFFAETKDALDSGLVGVGVTLRSQNVHLTEEFREFASAFGSQCGRVQEAFDLVFLSQVEPPLGLYCLCHGHIEENKLGYFRLALRRKPNSPPPEDLVQTSAKLDGFPTGFSKLLSALGRQEAHWRASFDAAIIAPKHWRLRFGKRKPPPGIGSLRLNREEIFFSDINEKTEVVITFQAGASAYSMQVKSEIEAKLDEACFEQAAEQLWSRVQSLFQRNEPT